MSFSAALIGFVMLNFSFEFHTFLWDLEKKKFLKLMFYMLRGLLDVWNFF